MALTCDISLREVGLYRQITAEFTEMPGLSLTTRQAARLWQIDLARCESALRHLENVGFLRRHGDHYVRADVECHVG